MLTVETKEISREGRIHVFEVWAVRNGMQFTIKYKAEVITPPFAEEIEETLPFQVRIPEQAPGQVCRVKYDYRLSAEDALRVAFSSALDGWMSGRSMLWEPDIMTDEGMRYALGERSRA